MKKRSWAVTFIDSDIGYEQYYEAYAFNRFGALKEAYICWFSLWPKSTFKVISVAETV